MSIKTISEDFLKEYFNKETLISIIKHTLLLSALTVTQYFIFFK